MRAWCNGVELAYDAIGSGRPVLLVHGYPLCRRMWRPQVPALVAAGCRVVSVDLRGFGESEVVPGPYGMELFADDLVALLDQLGIQQAVVGGMSMGGYVLLNLLERYPERVAAALFICTRANADDEAGRARRLALAQQVREQGPQLVSDAFRELLFAPASLTERPKLVSEVCAWMAGTDSRGLAGGLLAMRERRDYLELLGSFRQPALVVAGAEDRAVPFAATQALAAGLADARLRVISDAGHMANLEQPGDVNRALTEFLVSLG